MSSSTTKSILAARTEGDSRWAAVKSRDAGADGTFFYSVRSTGVYCRPSCASRLARPENVEFHPTTDAAVAAGFRACKRCRPNEMALADQHAEKVIAACRAIETADHTPTLERLAGASGMSPFYFHRVFKATTGLTPREYAAAHRGRRVRTALDRNATVTRAIYDAGYQSNGRFYAESDSLLGMTPSDFRAGGATTEIRFAIGQCSLGAILVACTARGVCAITMGDDPARLAGDLQDRFPRATLTAGDAEYERVVATVIGFVEAPRLGLGLPLDVQGTAFQHRVWRALQEIPPGQTASYAEIAARIGAPTSARAVATACAGNPVAIAIPCHRVIRGDGGLSGYRWGVERKRALLEREAAG